MHDDFNSFKQNPTQKFCKNLINFEKPQIVSKKSQKLGQNNEMHDKMREMRLYQMNKTWFGQKIGWGMWRGWV